MDEPWWRRWPLPPLERCVDSILVDSNGVARRLWSQEKRKGGSSWQPDALEGRVWLIIVANSYAWPLVVEKSSTMQSRCSFRSMPTARYQMIVIVAEVLLS